MNSANKAVISQLWNRKNSEYEAGSFSDGHHVALVVEGGGMRGVTSGAMVAALEDLGLTCCFDSVHGSSAGAAACAYFVAGQANFGTSIYFEDLNDNQFIDLYRMLRFQHIMDTSYLVDHVMEKIKPINFQNISESRTKLNIVSTDIDTGFPVIYSHFDSYDDFKQVLKSTITLPFIAGKPKEIYGSRLMDGGLVQQVAIDSALEAGATMVLVYQTRRKDEQIRPVDSFKVRLQSFGLQLLYGGKIGKIYRARNGKINNTVQILEAGVGPNGELLGKINLQDSIDFIHRLTKDPQLLKTAAEITKNYITEELLSP